MSLSTFQQPGAVASFSQWRYTHAPWKGLRIHRSLVLSIWYNALLYHSQWSKICIIHEQILDERRLTLSMGIEAISHVKDSSHDTFRQRYEHRSIPKRRWQLFATTIVFSPFSRIFCKSDTDILCITFAPMYTGLYICTDECRIYLSNVWLRRCSSK